MSGSVTLGGFAKNWRISRVGYAYAIQLGKMLQPERQFENDNEVPYLKSQHVQAGVVVSEDLPLMWANLAETSKYSVRDGDLLVCEGGDVGRAAIAVHVPEDTIIQNALHRVRSSGGNSLTYLLYVLLHIKNHGWFDIICNKSTIAHLTREKLSALAIPLPPPLVQRSIAAHLDRETAKIDTLIGKKRELIAKLKEQRSALISRTVTHGLPPEAAQAAGLDPNPPMKNSGVEWLGEVPGHWALTKFSRGVYIEEGQVDPEDIEHRDSIMIAPNHIESGTGRLITMETADEQGAISGKYRCQAGDVVYSKIRPALRKVVIVDEDCLCSADMYPLRSGPRISARYLWYFLLTDQFTAWAKLESDRVAMPKINRESINQIQIPTPPTVEQMAIGNYLIEQTGRLDALLGRVETAITRLTEYRAALITAAVTGQLNITSAG